MKYPDSKKDASVLTLIVGAKAIAIETTRIQAAGATLQHDVHVLACSVMKHVTTNRNINVLTDFLAAVPDMVRKNSLQLWFETFGTVTYIDKQWTFDAKKKVRMGDAMIKPFWKFKALEGAPYMPLDFDVWAEHAVKKLEKDAKETGRDYSPLIVALKTYHVDAVKGGTQH